DAPRLSADQQESWERPDHVRQTLAPYADPYVYVDVEIVRPTSGPFQNHSFAIITVHEFDEIPVLCGQGGRDARGNIVLEAGACYVRTSHMPATTTVANHTQFREVIELAVEKGVRKLIRRARAAGLTGEGAPADAELYEQQARNFDE